RVVGGRGVSSSGFATSAGVSGGEGCAGRAVSIGGGVGRGRVGVLRTGSSGNAIGGGTSGSWTSTTRGGGSGISRGVGAVTALARRPKQPEVNQPHITSGRNASARLRDRNNGRGITRISLLFALDAAGGFETSCPSLELTLSQS